MKALNLFSRRTILYTLLLGSFALADDPSTCRVVTLNTWLLRIPLKGDIAQDINTRLDLIPRMINDQGGDILFLQEVWGEALLAKMKKAFEAIPLTPNSNKPKYPYSAAGGKKGWVFGNGLLIVSKYPLDASKFDSMRFSKFTRTDESVISKGAIYARVTIPGYGDVGLINTHLGVTTYDPKSGNFDRSEMERKADQLRELVEWVKKKQKEEKIPIILAGDFNNHWAAITHGKIENKLSEGYQLLVGKRPEELGFLDTYGEKNPRVAETPASPDRGVTTDTKNNRYCNSNPFDKALAKQPSVTDDYIFVPPTGEIKILASQIIFDRGIPAAYREELIRHKQKVPAGASDHNGVQTDLELVHH